MIKFIKRIKQRFIKYWLGDVLVTKQNILCNDYKNRLYEFRIIPSRFRQAHWFGELDPKMIPELITKLELNKKRFNLHIDYGCGAYQDYTFNKYQQKLLLEDLRKLVNEEIYDENKEY